MSTEKTSMSENNDNINYVDIVNDNISEKETNIFEKSEEKTDSLNIQVKSKGGSKLRSWIYNWGERKIHPKDSKKFIFECNQPLDSGEICIAKIEISDST